MPLLPTEPPRSDDVAAVPPRRALRWLGTGFVGLVALLALGLWGTTVAGRWLDSPPALITVMVTFLPYGYAVVAVLAVLAWVATPRRGLAGALALMVLISGGLLWGPSFGCRASTADGVPLRLVEWNVRRLWGGPGDGGDALDCVVRTLRDLEPDVITLLEVSAADVDALAEPLGLQCTHTDYHGAGSDRSGGLAACTRGGRWQLRSGAAPRYVDGDPWRYALSEVEHEGRVVNVAAVHLRPYTFSAAAHLRRGEPLEAMRVGEATTAVQASQTRALIGRVARFRDPTILAGDFNSVRDAAVHVALRRHLTDTFEVGGSGFGATIWFRGWVPLRIDYVYTSDALGVVSATVPAADCSDHRPVVADLVLRDTAADVQ